MVCGKTQSIYAVSAVFDGIRAIDQDFVRCFLIEGTERAVLLDTCDADADLPGLVGSLTDLPVIVVHTHADSDHIGASDRFAETYMHPSEFALLYEAYSKTLRPRPIREGETLRLGGRVERRRVDHLELVDDASLQGGVHAPQGATGRSRLSTRGGPARVPDGDRPGPATRSEHDNEFQLA